MQLNKETEKFFYDRNRLTAAITRVKEGEIILSSKTVSINSPIWRESFFELESRSDTVLLNDSMNFLDC